jgi:hypothetical protein
VLADPELLCAGGVENLTGPSWHAGSAETLVDEFIDGTQCRHVRARADLDLAATESMHGMSPPLFPRGPRIPMPFDAWIDASSRLRRIRAGATFPDPEDSTDELFDGAYELTLSELGRTPPPTPPAAAETATADPRSLFNVGEALVTSWVERIREVVPGDVTVTHDGKATFAVRAGRGSSVVTPMIVLAIPGTGTQELRRAYRHHAEALQELLSDTRRSEWPGPGAITHVEVGPDEINVWWSSSTMPEATVRLRPIPRAELGI